MQIDIQITGTTPLLMNKFTDAQQLNATSGPGTVARDKDMSPYDQASQKIYSDEDGTIVVPQPNLFRCLIDAGKYFQYQGKSKVTTQKSSIIPAAVTIPGITLPLKFSDPWTVDTRPIRIPATGGRILTHRPCFNDWSLEFTAVLDTQVISERLFRQIVDKAGSAIGLGDFRPDTKGPFGKFVVTRWVSGE
jgi:hypothetical protein